MTAAASDWLGTCDVCRRRHMNVGYAPSDRHPVKWTCRACLKAAEDPILVQKIYHMPRKRLDEFEERALAKGGETAGSYLDDIGKTDLAVLSAEEWEEFCARLLVGYSNAMREMLSKDEAPF